MGTVNVVAAVFVVGVVAIEDAVVVTAIGKMDDGMLQVPCAPEIPHSESVEQKKMHFLDSIKHLL